MQDKYGREIYRCDDDTTIPLVRLYVSHRSDDFDHGRSHRHGEPRVLSMDNNYSSRRPRSAFNQVLFEASLC